MENRGAGLSATADTAGAPGLFFDAELLKKLERLHLVAKRLNWGGLKGEHAAVRKGHSLEFSDYRRYQRGDDLRYVDWNVYRRLERLLLKVFTAEQEMNVYLLVDTSLSMAEGRPAKIDYARHVAAALGYIALKNLDRVGGASFSSRLQAKLSMGRGRRQILGLFDFLARLSCDGRTDFLDAVKSFGALFAQPGLVVVVSDLMDPAGCRAGLEELCRRGHQLLVVHILDPDELHPMAAGEVTLLDVEQPRERRTFIDAELVRLFEQELARYLAEIEAVCAGWKIDYVRTTTHVAFDEFVLQMLRRTRSVT
ncbi:MAG TPA: DUF58 domain-containing protein [candidate division Zixibacteria bacterium]|nr:DUF58 domain-containing protein [candidate division Zixibacteria bacterium]